ncbi:MAG: M42 family metallopeptidase [Acidobacteriaceae bacterium]
MLPPITWREWPQKLLSVQITRRKSRKQEGRKIVLKIIVLLVGLGFMFPSSGRTQQADSVIPLMKEFTSANGPSGFEGPVRTLFEREMRNAGAEISTDGLGSVIARAPGGVASPRIMVAAHLDEVGLMVQSITRDGYIKVQRLGGLVGANLIGQRWTIMTSKGTLPAVSGAEDAHMSTPEGVNWSIDPKNIFLDVGARSKADAEALGIQIGDGIAPSSPFTILANQRYATKAWDDRIGLILEIEALKQLQKQGVKSPNSIYFAGTVQEEVGMRGAVTAAHQIRPDVGIALEVGFAGDYPSMNSDQPAQKLGGGPGVLVYDSSAIPNAKLLKLVRDTAAANHIALQPGLWSRGAEDASSIQKSANGIPVICILVPTRYTHANTGVIQRSDFDNAVILLVDLLKNLDASTVKGLTDFQ